MALPLMLTACQEPSSTQNPTVASLPSPTKSQEASPAWSGALPAASITFRRPEGEPKNFTVAELSERFGVVVVPTMDPYYQQQKNFYAIPLAPLLNEIFASQSDKLQTSELMFEALDGYTVRLPGQLALHPAAHLAFAEAETKALAPIGEQKVPAGPLYLIWKGDDFTDKTTHPRPWGLSRITLLSGSDSYQHLTPPGGFKKSDALAQAGFLYFQKDCLHCHAINQEGGKLGPDLNVPRNILAYRDEAQVRAFIKNPRQFRYSSMPPHPNLSESDLDGIIAYLKLMGQHQHDPHPAPPSVSP